MSQPLTYRQLREAMPIRDGGESLFAGHIDRRLNHPEPGLRLSIDMDYQRGHVWSVKQSAAFVGHKLEGGEAPNLTIRRDGAVNEPTNRKQPLRIVCCPIRADVLLLYLKLNRGGSVHTDDEIERVRDLLRVEQAAP